MHNIAVLRLLDNALVWYPPGAGEQPRPLDSEEAIRALRDTTTQQHWSLCFAAPAAAIRLLPLSITAEEKKHLSQSLPFMLEEQVAQDIDRLHFAAAEDDKLNYTVAVCERAAMDDWSAQLASAGTVRQWLPETLLLPWQEGEWNLLLEDERAIVRTGYGAGFGCELSLLPVLLQAAAAEQEPRTVIVYGSDQARELTLLPQTLQDRVQWRRGNLCSALMLTETLPPLNLRQGDYAPRLPLERWWREWRWVAAVFAAVFCLQLLATWLDYRSLAQENLALRTAREASYREANPRGNVVDPEKQLQRQVDALRGTTSGEGFVMLMDQVGKVLDAEKGALLASLNYSDRGGDMRMNLVATDFESVERIRAGLNAAGLVATMESSSAQGDSVRARIRVGGRS